MMYEPAPEGMTDEVDSEEVGEFAFEAAGGKTRMRKGRKDWFGAVESNVELDALVVGGAGEQVHDAQGVAVVVSGDERESEAVV